MTTLGKPVAWTAATTYDITEADLAGANSGQRPDLIKREQAIYRVGGLLYTSNGEQLVKADHVVASYAVDANGALIGLRGPDGEVLRELPGTVAFRKSTREDLLMGERGEIDRPELVVLSDFRSLALLDHGRPTLEFSSIPANQVQYAPDGQVAGLDVGLNGINAGVACWGALQLAAYSNGERSTLGDVYINAAYVNANSTPEEAALGVGSVVIKAGHDTAGECGYTRIVTGETDQPAIAVTSSQLGPAKIGFFDAVPVLKPIVTGAKAGNTPLVLSLLAALASLGLIQDSTT